MCRVRFVVSAFVAAALALTGGASPTSAWGTSIELNDSEEPGSVLVFHKFIRGTVDLDLPTDPTGLVSITVPRTELEISVTCPKDLRNPDGTCRAAGAKVHLMAHWVCGSRYDGFCEETDFPLETTVNGTIFLNPEGGPLAILDPLDPLFVDYEQVPPAPCDYGYLIVWVTEGRGGPAIKFDGLIGDAILRHAVRNGEMWAQQVESETASGYNALPIQAVSSLTTGAVTNVDQDTTGDLDFDGMTEYKAVTGKISGTVRYNQAMLQVEVPDPTDTTQVIDVLPFVKTHLTLLTLDVKSNRVNNPTFVDLNFYDEDENFISGVWGFFCWTEVDLQDINEDLDTNFGGFGARKGLFESTSAEKQGYNGVEDSTGPVTILGLVTTIEFDEEEAETEYTYSLYHDSEPVPTIFVPKGNNFVPPEESPSDPPGPTSTITFDEYYTGPLDGEYPSGVVNWGSGAWYLSGPWGQFTTNSISFNGAGPTSASFTFVSPKTLVSLKAYNGGADASTITISCGGNPTTTVTVNAGQLVTISTGWSNACSLVTIGSSNGWDTNFDDVTYQ